MSVGRNPEQNAPIISAPKPLEPPTPTQTERLHVASEIIKLAIGPTACYASKVRLARKYDYEQLKDILYLLKSFTEG